MSPSSNLHHFLSIPYYLTLKLGFRSLLTFNALHTDLKKILYCLFPSNKVGSFHIHPRNYNFLRHQKFTLKLLK